MKSIEPDCPICGTNLVNESAHCVECGEDRTEDVLKANRLSAKRYILFMLKQRCKYCRASWVKFIHKPDLCAGCKITVAIENLKKGI